MSSSEDEAYDNGVFSTQPGIWNVEFLCEESLSFTARCLRLYLQTVHHLPQLSILSTSSQPPLFCHSTWSYPTVHTTSSPVSTPQLQRSPPQTSPFTFTFNTTSLWGAPLAPSFASPPQAITTVVQLVLYLFVYLFVHFQESELCILHFGVGGLSISFRQRWSIFSMVYIHMSRSIIFAMMRNKPNYI